MPFVTHIAGASLLEKEMKAKPIDVELVRSLFRYDPSVGGSCLVWKIDVGINGKVKAGTRAGCLSRYGYWRVKVNRNSYPAHRIIWVLVHGEDPPCQVDHKDGKEAGNHIENLRLAYNNHYDNNKNITLPKTNTSGYMGVSFHKATGKYQGKIVSDGKAYYLGLFDTPEEAHEAYLKAKAELHKFNPQPR